MVRISFEPYFLHKEQVVGLLGVDRVAVALARTSAVPIAEPYLLAAALAEALPVLGIAELQKLVHEQTLQVGQTVGVEQTFHFRRVPTRDRTGDRPIDFTATLNTDDAIIVQGSFNSARLATDSSSGNVAGRRPAYIVGCVTSWNGTKIELRPAFIGVRSFVQDDELATYGIASSRRIYPGLVDQFAEVDFRSSVTSDELGTVLAVSEETVKTAFAAMVGEPYIPKDWGGERSDLYTSRLHVDGRPVSSAWIFKGPGYPRPMTVRALGKPGDQINRLFSEPAELLVLQHCHEITPAVVNMMETYAHDLRNPRKYMIIDGADTARILMANGTIPRGGTKG